MRSSNSFHAQRVKYIAWSGGFVQKIATAEKSVMKVELSGEITR